MNKYLFASLTERYISVEARKRCPPPLTVNSFLKPSSSATHRELFLEALVQHQLSDVLSQLCDLDIGAGFTLDVVQSTYRTEEEESRGPHFYTPMKILPVHAFTRLECVKHYMR